MPFKLRQFCNVATDYSCVFLAFSLNPTDHHHIDSGKSCFFSPQKFTEINLPKIIPPRPGHKTQELNLALSNVRFYSLLSHFYIKFSIQKATTGPVLALPPWSP